MPRIRSIKPEAPQHRKVGRLTDREFRIWATCITQADDEGRLVCEPEQVRVWAFAYHPETTVELVEDAIQAIATTKLFILYNVNGVRYSYFPSWKDHQRINRPTPSKLPAPPAINEDSRSTHGPINDGSYTTQSPLTGDVDYGMGSEGIGREGRGREGRGREGNGVEGIVRGTEPPPASAPVVAPAVLGQDGLSGELQSQLEELRRKRDEIAKRR